MTKAVVLFSGGLDSLLALYHATLVHDVTALYINYGQPTKANDANAVFNILSTEQFASVEYELIKLDTVGIWEKCKDSVGYYPQRNLFLLTMGAMLCDTIGAHDLYFGAQGYQSYPDCLPEWMHKAAVCLNHGRKDSEGKNWINLQLPALHMTKAQIIESCLDNDLPVEHTVACYDETTGEPCGKCPGCTDRAEAFIELNLADPAIFSVGGN